MTLYPHPSEVPWDAARWPNFRPDEPNLACPCCGEFFLDGWMMDGLQRIRKGLGRGVTVNSGHRCPIHNAHVGGAPLSEHRRVAWDVSVLGHDRAAVLRLALEYGFTTFGFYRTFLHVDPRPGRRWFGAGGEEAWNGMDIYNL